MILREGAETLFAVFAEHVDERDPLSGLRVGARPTPETPLGWTRVRVEAASLNHHDIWSLRGAGLPTDRLPMILGCDKVHDGLGQHRPYP